jgi:hypothetical protein
MSKLYLIENSGCDDETTGLVRFNDEGEFCHFKDIIENLNANSYYGCMPKINVYEILEEDVKEVTYYNPNAQYGEPGYVYRRDLLFMGNKLYTFNIALSTIYNERTKVI